MSWLDKFKETPDQKERKIFKKFLDKNTWENNQNIKNTEMGLENILGVYYYHIDTDVYRKSQWKKSNQADTYPEENQKEELSGMIDVILEVRNIEPLNIDKSKILQWKKDYIDQVVSSGAITTYTSDGWYDHGHQYIVHKIDLNDFIEKVCTPEQVQLYKEVKNSMAPIAKSKLKP